MLPSRLPLDAATIIETLATVRHAQHRVGVSTAESVVVLGQGTAGLLHTRLAVLTGATPVIAVSRTKWKLEMAERGELGRLGPEARGIGRLGRAQRNDDGRHR